MATPDSLQFLRVALIVWGLIAAQGLLIGFLVVGHLTHKFDLFDMPRDARTKQVVWRLVGEMLVFPVGEGVVLLAAVHNHPDLALILFVMLGTYATRSVVGAVMASRSGMAQRFTPPPPMGEAQPSFIRVGRGQVQEG